MGKISEALSRYAREHRTVERPPIPQTVALNSVDVDALIHYDRETGHLLRYDRHTGQVNGNRIDALRRRGTIQRLLENKLIYPGGKLTPTGIEQAERFTEARKGQGAADHYRSGGPDTRVPAGSTKETAVCDSSLPETAEEDVGEHRDIAASSSAEMDDVVLAYVPVDTKSDELADPGRVQVPAPTAFQTETYPDGPALTAKGASSGEVFRKALAGGTETQAQPAYSEAAIDANLVALLDPQSYEAEQFKILRTNILYPVSGKPPRSILVTSSAPEEGKTFTAANLAISIALNINKHVLLIDADLRRPQLHSRFGFSEVPGLSNYLAKGLPLPSLLLKTKVDKLTLLPGGPSPDNPSELISSERMANLLAEVSERYKDRLIVIDAPPPGMTAETGVLARQVDGILVVVRHGRTRYDELGDLVGRIGDDKILGCIVNHVETADSRYYGYKYGGYPRRRA